MSSLIVFGHLNICQLYSNLNHVINFTYGILYKVLKLFKFISKSFIHILFGFKLVNFFPLQMRILFYSGIIFFIFYSTFLYWRRIDSPYILWSEGRFS